MNWITIENQETISEINTVSQQEKILFLKYDPDCALNYVVRILLEREWIDSEMNMKTYILDIKKYGDISRSVTEIYKVENETPQIIILEKGKPVFSASHGKILFSELKNFAN